MRRKLPSRPLPPREIEICARLAEARDRLGISRQEAARKIGIPQSTLSNFELCVAPLRAEMALRICRKLIVSEEWLATGKFELTEQEARSRGIDPDEDLRNFFYFRQCMDLLGSEEAAQLPRGILFSDAFDKFLAPVFERRIHPNFYMPAIPASAWKDRDLEQGRDILLVIIERYLRIISNEALHRKSSPQHAGAVYLGFLIRMSIFGFYKCMGKPLTIDQLNLPIALFAEAGCPIEAFKSEVELRAAADFAPITR